MYVRLHDVLPELSLGLGGGTHFLPRIVPGTKGTWSGISGVFKAWSFKKSCNFCLSKGAWKWKDFLKHWHGQGVPFYLSILYLYCEFHFMEQGRVPVKCGFKSVPSQQYFEFAALVLA